MVTVMAKPVNFDKRMRSRYEAEAKRKAAKNRLYESSTDFHFGANTVKKSKRSGGGGS